MRNMDAPSFIHHMNIQALVAEMFKIKNDLSIASDMFCP